MMKKVVVRRFSNFESATVRDPGRLSAALQALQPMIADPLFRTRIGATFAYEQIEAAMAYDGRSGTKAILIA
jgi:hypothetical protein